MKKAVFYRANPVLTALVAKAQPEFVHEFPAEMSVENISAVLKEAMGRLAAKERADEGPHDWKIHVDATVWMADKDKILEDHRPFIIRQDNVGAYDLYAEQVANAAKQKVASTTWEPTVVVIFDRLADHNSEVEQVPSDDGLRRVEAQIKVVRRWVERLRSYGVVPEIMEAGWFEKTCQYMNLNRKVVVCDHHNGDKTCDLAWQHGGEWFNAFPPCSDDEFLNGAG